MEYKINQTSNDVIESIYNNRGINDDEIDKWLYADSTAWEDPSNYPDIDCATLKDIRKELTKYRENNADTLKNIRNTISAHRDKDVTVQIDMIENVHLSDALQLISEYEQIMNELGGAVSPIKQLGISRLQSVFGK